MSNKNKVEKGIEILNQINLNTEAYKVENNNVDQHQYNRKAYNIKATIYSYSFINSSYIVIIFDNNKNGILFEEFCKLNSSLTKTFSKKDLEKKIFSFLAENKTEITKEIYRKLLKELNQIKLSNIIVVSMFKGIFVDKEETLGNFKIRTLKFNEIEKIYGENCQFQYIIQHNTESFNKEQYSFLEYHNAKVRIIDTFPEYNYTNKLEEIYQEKFQQLSLVFNFLYKNHYNKNNEKSGFLSMEINHIFSPEFDNHIAIFEDSVSNLSYKGGPIFFNKEYMGVSLRDNIS